MPGSRLNDTERHLRDWWDGATKFEFSALTGISVKGTPGLRGITDLDLTFEYPLTVICGQNGSGKTTLLALAALAFHAPDGHHSYQARNYKTNNPKSYYTFVDFFFKGIRDPDITGVEIAWRYRGGRTLEKKIRKQSKKWMKYETRPKRPVHYFGASRILPAIERNVLRGHFRVKRSKHESRQLNADFLKIFSRILTRDYADAVVTKSEKHSLRSCGYGSTYTSFNMGAGEDTLIEMLYHLQEAPAGSLIVIEEAELGLHPAAQRKFAEELQEIAWKKKFQVIASSHSPDFIDNLPRISRIFVQRIGSTVHNIIQNPTTRYAMGFLHGDSQYELTAYCEDSFAEQILKKATSPELRKRTRVIGVGGVEQVAKLCGAHVRAKWEGNYLGVFDGDVAQNRAKSSIVKEMPPNCNGDDVNYYILPGDNLPPERWVVKEILCDEDRLEDLRSELGEENIEIAKSYLQRLKVLDDHHGIGYELSKNFGIDQLDAEKLLVRVACKNNVKLIPFSDKIHEIIDNMPMRA